MKLNKTNDYSISAIDSGWIIKYKTKLLMIEVISFISVMMFMVNPFLIFTSIGSLFAVAGIEHRTAHRRNEYPRIPFYKKMIGKHPNLRVQAIILYPVITIGLVIIFLGSIVHGMLLNEQSGFFYAAIASFFVAKWGMSEVLYHLPIWSQKVNRENVFYQPK